MFAKYVKDAIVPANDAIDATIEKLKFQQCFMALR
jgi:hypothetical protein